MLNINQENTEYITRKSSNIFEDELNFFLSNLDDKNSEHHYKLAIAYSNLYDDENAFYHLIKAYQIDNELFNQILDDLPTKFCHFLQLAKKIAQKMHEINPNSYKPYFAMALLAKNYLDYKTAIFFINEALKIAPARVTLYCVLSECYYAIGESYDAINSLMLALKVNKNHLMRKFILSRKHHLRKGNYKLGLAYFETRYHYWFYGSEVYLKLPIAILPDNSQTLHIYDEAGFGDRIVNARYYKILKQLNYKFIIYTESFMVNIYNNMTSIEKIEIGYLPHEVEELIYSMSLAYHLQTRIDNLPLPELDFKQSFVKEQNILSDKNCKIGFVWHANLNLGMNRSMNLELFLNITAPELHLYCFQIEFTKDEEELMNKRGNITILKPQITDWADTAGFLEQMDLLITIDSGIANLASALGMGNKLWVMLPLDADWRWYCTKTNYPPWHPDARTFRQNKFNDWGNVIDDVRTELNKFLEDWAP